MLSTSMCLSLPVGGWMPLSAWPVSWTISWPVLDLLGLPPPNEVVGSGGRLAGSDLAATPGATGSSLSPDSNSPSSSKSSSSCLTGGGGGGGSSRLGATGRSAFWPELDPAARLSPALRSLLAKFSQRSHVASRLNHRVRSQCPKSWVVPRGD